MLRMETMYMDDCASSPDDVNLPHFSVILAEAGKKPFAKDKDGNNQIIASKGIFSGMGFYSLANLRVEKVNDQTKGSSFVSGKNPLEGAGGFVTNYELSMWNKLLGGDQAASGKAYNLALEKGFFGITFNDFLVRKITIRYKTFSEILADIGARSVGGGVPSPRPPVEKVRLSQQPGRRGDVDLQVPADEDALRNASGEIGRP